MWCVTHRPGVDSLFHVHSLAYIDFSGAATSTALAECLSQATWLKVLKWVHCTTKWQSLSRVNWRCLQVYTASSHHNRFQQVQVNSYIQFPQQLLGVTSPSQSLNYKAEVSHGWPLGSEVVRCVRACFVNPFVRRVTFRLTAIKLLLRHAHK